MSHGLSAALQAWSLQGPTLLQSVLAAKDAEIARLTAERDAQQTECISLRECIQSLQAAVDQLVALCTAQVTELAQQVHPNPQHLTSVPHPTDQLRTHVAAEEVRNGDTKEEKRHDDDDDDGVPVSVSAARKVDKHLGFAAHDNPGSRCATDIDFAGQERVCRKQSASSSQEPLSRKQSSTSESGEKVGRRSSFPGASSVSSNRPSPVVVPRTLDDGIDGEEQLRLWDGDFHDEGETELPPGHNWIPPSQQVDLHDDFCGNEGFGNVRGKQELIELDRSEERLQVLETPEEECPSQPGDVRSDIRQFTMEEVGQMTLPIFARPDSEFVDISDAGQCVIKDRAFFMYGSEMPCEMTVTLEPEEMDSAIATFIQFEYPDSTMLPFIPVCNLRVKGVHEDGIRDRQGCVTANTYGRDYVLLQLRCDMFNALVGNAKRLIRDLYPDAVLEEKNVPIDNSEHVEFFAQLMSPHPVMRGQRWDASITELLMESESDIVGDGTILMRFLERHGSTELDFVLHRMQLEDDTGNGRSVV